MAVSNSNRFIETTDGGDTWTSIRHNLPNITSNSVVFDGRTENGIYVSLSKGVYFKDDSTPTTWALVGAGLPMVNATELEIVNDKLYIATYGRGLWEIDVPGVGYTFNVNHELVDCISNGTMDSLDDSFTFMVDPKGMGLNSSYSISGDVTFSNVPYGTPFVLDNGGAGFLKQDGGVSITLTDDTNNSITKDVIVYPNLEENCFSNYVCMDAFPINGTGTYHALGPSTGQGATIEGRNANWFIFVPNSDGLLSINTCDRGEDTNLRVHSGDCSALTLEAANDDACSMGPGLNNWASQLNNIPVVSNKIYYIEWDSRWSSNSFFFEVAFEEECKDYLTVNVSSENEGIFKAATQITLEGTLNGFVGASTTGHVEINNLTLQDQSNLNVIRSVCELNNIFDAKVYSQENVDIPDNSSVEILYEFPAAITQQVGALSIGVDITHPDISELIISIVKPDGTEIPFWENSCSGEADLNFILDINAFPKELCGVSWRRGYPVYNANTFTTSEIQTLLQTNMAGTWKLKFEDSTGGNVGKVNSAFIYFKE